MLQLAMPRPVADLTGRPEGCFRVVFGDRTVPAPTRTGAETHTGHWSSRGGSYSAPSAEAAAFHKDANNMQRRGLFTGNLTRTEGEVRATSHDGARKKRGQNWGALGA